MSTGGTGNPRVVQSFSDNQKCLKQAIHNVENVIAPLLIKKKFDVHHDLNKIDEFLHQVAAGETGTGTYKLGNQEMMGVSMACSRAGAASAVCYP